MARSLCQYDGSDLIAEYDTSGGLEKRYVHGPGMDEPLVEYAGSGTGNRTFLHADARGSIIAHTNASGARTATLAYDEYGNPAASNTGRFQYTGQLWLNDAGVYHYKNRAYHPGLMRFLQADPIGVAGGINLYAYVGGDPVNFTDPWGLRRCITQYHYRVGDPVYDDDGEFIGWEAILIGQTEYCFARGVEFVRTEMAEGEGRGGDACGATDTPVRTEGNTPPADRGYVFGVYQGLMNSLSFGLFEQYLRAGEHLTGIDAYPINRNQGYDAGVLGSLGFGGFRAAYSGSAALVSAAGSGRSANAYRNALKGAMTGTGANHPRHLSYEQALRRYGSDDAVRRAAGRTSPVHNTAGGVALVGGGVALVSGATGC